MTSLRGSTSIPPPIRTSATAMPRRRGGRGGAPFALSVTTRRPFLQAARSVQSHNGRRMLSKIRSTATEDNIISLTSEDLQQSAIVGIQVLDANTAKVTVTTEDRPGLMRDVSSAISKLNLSIENATIITSNEGVEDTFLVKVSDDSSTDFEDGDCFFDKDGFVCESMLDKVRKVIFSEAIASWGLGITDEQKAEIDEQLIDPTVEVMKFDRAGSNSMMVRIEATDRPGILSAITSALSKIGVSIVSADIKTRYGCVYNKLIVDAPEEVKMESIRVAAVEAIQ